MLQKVKHGVGALWPALRSRNYRLYFIGQGISLIGTWMATVAEQWLIYPVLTNNRSLLGLVSAVNLAPTACFVLFAGVIADRVDKRKAQMLIQFLFALIALTMSVLIFTGRVQVWHVLLAVFLSGVVFAFDLPTRQALMIATVEKRVYASALSLNAGIFNAARALGPAAAGLIIAAVGIAPTYLINGLSFFAVIVSVALMQKHLGVSQAPNATIRDSFREGVTYVRTHMVIAVLLSLFFILTVSTWPAATLMAVFAHDIFGAGAVGFGMLQSAFGAGAMIGAFGFSKVFDLTKNIYRLLIGAIIAIAGSLCIFALSPAFSLAIAAQIVLGISISTMYSLVTTLVQSDVPHELRGRILSFTSFVLIGGMPIGALLASLGVATVGARLTVLLGAIFFGLTSFGLIAATRGKFHAKLARMG